MNDKDIKMHFNWGHITRLSILVFVLIVVTPACEDNFNSSIPYVRVDFSIRLTNYNHLTVDGNSAEFPGGYGGVIVTNSGFGFFANDATCPYEVDISCRVETNGDVIATCPCCGSKYSLLDGGSVIKGPSSEPLKPYNASQRGYEIFVTN